MGAYFSFERMITTSFVKVVYFLGFLAITAGGVALAVWAGMQLNDARIDRVLGWRYVAAGVGLVVIGNILWRVVCELWVVLFEIHAELVSVRYGLNLNGLREPVVVENEEVIRPREVVVQDHAPHASVLGLS
jgi:uncharacterized protein DUF4282